MSEFFTAELAVLLDCGRGTAAVRTRRAWPLRESLPGTRAAMATGDIEERRANVLADVLAHTDPTIAWMVEVRLLPEASGLSLTRLKEQAVALLLELDAEAVDRRQKQARAGADVRSYPSHQDGMGVLTAELPAEEAAACYALVDQLARMLKTDGDPRPIGEHRAAVLSMLILRPADHGLGSTTIPLTVTAALDALAGDSDQPGSVDGLPITAGHLRELLRRAGALGLTAPDHGSLTFALTDAYEPTDLQRAFVSTRDRRCRFPNCGQRVGWADQAFLQGPAASLRAVGGREVLRLCRSHHRLKTFAPGWHFALDDDGTLHVTTPSGVTRTTRPPGRIEHALTTAATLYIPDPLPDDPPPCDDRPPF